MVDKRIEYRGDYLRASRTGGVALRGHVKAGRIGVTANTGHGLRGSARITKGTYLALQNGQFRFVGRYGKGPLKLNVSKSGASASFKTGVGSLNFVRPNRSSATIAGIQVLGKNALILNLIAIVVQFGILTLQLAFTLLLGIAQVLAGLANVAFYTMQSAWQSLQEKRAEKRFQAHFTALPNWANTQFNEACAFVHDLNITRTKRAMVYLVTAYGRGLTMASGQFSAPRQNDVRLALDLLVTVRASREPYAEALALMLLLTDRFLALKSAEELASFYLKLDDLALADDGRTSLQWALLEVVSERGGIVIEPR